MLHRTRLHPSLDRPLSCKQIIASPERYICTAHLALSPALPLPTTTSHAPPTSDLRPFGSPSRSPHRPRRPHPLRPARRSLIVNSSHAAATKDKGCWTLRWLTYRRSLVLDVALTRTGREPSRAWSPHILECPFYPMPATLTQVLSSHHNRLAWSTPTIEHDFHDPTRVRFLYSTATIAAVSSAFGVARENARAVARLADLRALGDNQLHLAVSEIHPTLRSSRPRMDICRHGSRNAPTQTRGRHLGPRMRRLKPSISPASAYFSSAPYSTARILTGIKST